MMLHEVAESLRSAVRQRASLERVEHRPWPLPAGPWLMGQTWEDLLFAHWRVPEGDLRRLMPEPLELDTFDGSGWVGVTPFRLTGLRLRGMPPVPGVSNFPEINVRTYTTYGGKAGVFFFSLDAGSALAVAAARRLYRLPYFEANVSATREDGGPEKGAVRFRSRRKGSPEMEFAWNATYGTAGAASEPAAGTLEYFLTERYCLHVLSHRDQVLTAEIHHEPWSLAPAEARIDLNTMAPSDLRERLTVAPAALHFARRQHAVFWPLRRA